MESERRKVYVEVNVTHRPDGTARPNFIKFENDEKYEIDLPALRVEQQGCAREAGRCARKADGGVAGRSISVLL